MFQTPTFPFSLPACWEWHEGDLLPQGLTFVKGPLTEDMYIKVCLVQVSPPKITVEKKNVAEIDVDIKGCLKWVFKHMAGLPEWSGKIPKAPEDWATDKMNECVSYVKSVHNKFDVEITSDLTEEKVCFVLPTEWRFKGILKNNVPIPFNVTDTNKVCFTVTHASPTLITIQLISDITQITSSAINVAVAGVALLFVVSLMTVLIRTVKEAMPRS
jgi:hypothetical protein